jgi:hypothetical protein
MQNQFGLKPKMQGPAYTPPFLEWYYRVILPPRVKPPTKFTKFFGLVVLRLEAKSVFLPVGHQGVAVRL